MPETEEFPESVPDFLGQPVKIGDIIGYASLIGRSATMSVGKVLGFHWTNPSYSKPELKIKVQGTAESWRQGDTTLEYKKPGYLVAHYRRFVKMPDTTSELLPE